MTLSPVEELHDLAAGVVQTAGTITLGKTAVDQSGNTYNILFTQTDPGAHITGNTTATFLPHTTALSVTDSLGIDPNGSDVSAVSNGYTQSVIPEPGTLALFGSGILGIAGLLRRKTA